MGFLPRDPLFRDDTKGDACPPLESPAGLLNILPDDGYSRRCVVRTMFRQAPIETCIPLRGRQAEYRRPPDYRLDKKTIFSGRAVSSLIQTNWEKESKTLVLAVFRFTFGRPKVNPGVWGRVVPTRPEPRGSGARTPRDARGVLGRPHMLPNRMAAIRKKKCFSPARPVMGEFEPIGATRWHRAQTTGPPAL